MRLLLAGSLALALSTALAAPASADWPTTPIPLFVLDCHQFRMYPDGIGGFVLSFYASSSFKIVRDMRLNPDGSPDPGIDPFGTNIGSYTHDHSFPDGAGGLFRGFSSGNLSMLHYLPSGIDPAWPVGGLSIAATASYEGAPALAPDGAGGAFIAYTNGTIGNAVVKRVLANGTFAPGWPAGGRVFGSGVPIDPNFCGLQSDGTGGVFLLWSKAIDLSINLVRLTAGGAAATGWTLGGILIGGFESLGNPPKFLDVVPSGPGHWIAAWRLTSGSSASVFVERFDGDGNVDAGWNPGGGLQLGPASPSTAVNGVAVVSDGVDGVWAVWSEPGLIRGTHVTADGTIDHDSVQLTPAGATAYLDPSQPIAPGRNRGLVLGWLDQVGPSSFQNYARWLAADGSLEPNQPDEGIAFGGGDYSLLSDGNDGVYALAGSQGGSAQWLPFPQAPAGVELPRAAQALSLAAPSPNPARDAIDVRFTLASSGSASLDLVDLAGRRVRGLAVEGAGARSARFDHLSELPAGVYFVRLDQNGRFHSARVALVH